MDTLIAMLRGINVGGHKPVPMLDLKAMFAGLGLGSARTYVQSGNVVFQTSDSDLPHLRQIIENRFESVFGFNVPFLIRTLPDFEKIINRNPFLTGRSEDPAKLHVTFLDNLPDPTLLGKLAPPRDITDEFIITDRAVYLFCPGGYGKTKLNPAFFESKLKVNTTTRNWNTANILYKMALEE